MAWCGWTRHLADQGMWSRKDVKALIRKGQVTVGGIPETDPGRKVDRDKDRVMVSGPGNCPQRTPVSDAPQAGGRGVRHQG